MMVAGGMNRKTTKNQIARLKEQAKQAETAAVEREILGRID